MNLTPELEEELVSTITTDRAAVIEGCRHNLDFLASLILVDIYEYGYPPLFHAVWQLICKEAADGKGKPKYALGIPRGFSKTVVLKLYVVWCVLFTQRHFILVVCNTATLAENFVSDVADMLSSNNIVTIFGAWNDDSKLENRTYKQVNFRGRDITIAALGAGSSLRGLNLKYRRPDVVILDDMQNRDQAKNPEIAAELLVWLVGTLMKACDPHTCIFIYVGNMYPFEGSILRKLKHSPDWLSFITGAILADGQSLWPEHRTIEDLLDELRTDTEMGHPEIFYAEVMNDETAGTVSGIDLSKVPICPPHLDHMYPQGGFVIIDPSLGKTKQKGDDCVITAFLLYDGIPVARKLLSSKFDPYETIKKATELALEFNIGLIGVEGGAYQGSLVFWFNFVYQQLGVKGIQVGELPVKQLAKNAKIREMLGLVLSGKILLHKEVRSAVFAQVSQWNPHTAKNVDGILDTLSYAYKMIEMYEEFLPLLISAESHDKVESGGASSSNTNLVLPF